MTALLTAAAASLCQVAGITGAGAGPVAIAVGQLVIRAVPTLVAYLILVHRFERRSAAELAPRRLVPDGLTGLALGAALVSLMVAVLTLLHSYRVVGYRPDVAWLPVSLVIGLGAAISEEIAFRGVFFRIVEEWLGTWPALGASALVFGVAHAHNPAATAWSSIAIAVEAGVLIGLVFHVTRSLWACMGLHAAWNVVEGLVFGSPVSGMPIEGWLISTRGGPNWLSGGAFGLEASPAALGVSVLASAALIGVLARRARNTLSGNGTGR